MNFIYRLLLSVSSTSLLIAIFLVKSKVYITPLNDVVIENFPFLNSLLPLSLVVYFLIPIGLTGMAVFLSKYLGKDEFGNSEIEELEYAGNSFLPSYLGYFFVALSIADNDFFTMAILYIILFLFVFLSKTFYFNPIFLIFGYHFYQVKTQSGLKIFLITKKVLKKPKDIEACEVYRINDFTFIERGN